MHVIPTAVKRARVLTSARVGRRDLVFASVKKSKLYNYPNFAYLTIPDSSDR